MSTRQPRDPIQETIREMEHWHDHQYDPGTYVGSRFPPHLSGKRPNRWGYVLIVEGIIGVLICAFLLVVAEPQPKLLDNVLPFLGWLLILVLFAVIPLLSGLWLIQKPLWRRRRK